MVTVFKRKAGPNKCPDWEHALSNPVSPLTTDILKTGDASEQLESPSYLELNILLFEYSGRPLFRVRQSQARIPLYWE